MAELSKTPPKIPFFFRIYSEDKQGIVYEATKQVGNSAFNCTGSRPIGSCHGKKVWLLGGYMDVMPDAAMYDIIETPTKVSSSEVTQIVKDAGLDASVKKMTCYGDEHGYWFCENRGRSKSKSRSKKGTSNSKSRSRSGSNNSTNRRKTRGKSRGK
jgi:hypothetical protein